MKQVVFISVLMLLTSCNIADRLSRVGKAPDLNQINDYDNAVSAQYPDAAGVEEDGKVANVKTANSLWRQGSRTFFRDQRARSVGDILKVVVIIQDSAKLDNKTETKRNESGSTGIPAFGGFEKEFERKLLPEGGDPSNLISVKSTDNNKGEGKIDRKETINTTIAATVVKIMSSNNLVIKGSQEVRVNNELREVTVEGVVRPEDISAENSVTLDQIAEARISYGGRGNVSDYQQPRYGKQVLDAISPF
jgi:flagellar L-ring protein FlgH